MKLAFLGLGKMGSGIVRNLVAAQHNVTVWNRTSRRAADLAGVTVAGSPATAVDGVDAVLTMLADDHAVESVALGDDGFLAAMPRHAIHVSLSTIGVACSRRLQAAHAEHGQAFVAAPVFGRPEAAAAAKLLVAAAGPAEALDRVQPLFDAIGRRTFRLGDEPWRANTVKLCGNFMIASVLETFGEAVATARKSGIDPAAFLDVIATLFQSPIYKNYGKGIVRQDFTPGFGLALGLKDIRLALAAADSVSASMPLASLLHDRLLAAYARGQGDLDWSSLALLAAADAGLST